MSIRAVVGQLTDARNRLVQARQVGTYAATSISESHQLVDGVLDAVADKALSEAIGVHSRAVLVEVRGIDVLCAGVDEATTRAQQVGGPRR